jgi:hypothetical protein
VRQRVTTSGTSGVQPSPHTADSAAAAAAVEVMASCKHAQDEEVDWVRQAGRQAGKARQARQAGAPWHDDECATAPGPFAATTTPPRPSEIARPMAGRWLGLLPVYTT